MFGDVSETQATVVTGQGLWVCHNDQRSGIARGCECDSASGFRDRGAVVYGHQQECDIINSLATPVVETGTNHPKGVIHHFLHPCLVDM